MMTCEEAVLLLSARLDGELTATEEAALKDHLARCPECRAIAAQLEELHSAVADMEDMSAPADFTRRVMDRLGEQEKPDKVIPLFRRPQLKAITGLAACALLCVGLYSSRNHQSIQPATLSIGREHPASEVTPQVATQKDPQIPAEDPPASSTPSQSGTQGKHEATVGENTAPGVVPRGTVPENPQAPASVSPFSAETGTRTTELEDAYNTVSRSGGALIALQIPEGWNVESVEEQGRTGFRFRPEGREGAVCLCHYEEPVGMCGTGLAVEQVALPSGRTWTVGTYDGHAVWDFLYPGKEPGPFLVELEPGAADWWAEFKGEALEILDSALLEQN